MTYTFCFNLYHQNRYVAIFLYFNLTQPIQAAIAELYNRYNVLLFSLCNTCLFFDHLQWSHIIYCNGIMSFHHIIWCEAADKTVVGCGSHYYFFICIIPQNGRIINVTRCGICFLLQSKYTKIIKK